MIRPKTRGELKNKLKEGISCEVPSYYAEMMATMLRGWSKFDDFIYYASEENIGWHIFEPK